MFLNKKAWHTFMSICLCIAVLCITNKHSLLRLETGEGATEKSRFGAGILIPPRREFPHPGCPLRFPGRHFWLGYFPLIISSFFLTGAWSPQAALRSPNPFSSPSPAVSWVSYPLTPNTITNLSFSLSGHCPWIGENYNLIDSSGLSG